MLLLDRAVRVNFRKIHVSNEFTLSVEITDDQTGKQRKVDMACIRMEKLLFCFLNCSEVKEKCSTGTSS